MKDLIEKLAQAEGPSRAIDVLIWQQVCPDQYAVFVRDARAMAGRDWDEARRSKDLRDKAQRISPRYTASIDAALTLVPDGATGLISIGLGYARIERSDGTHWSGDADTPALALCTAALSAKEPSQ